jgi:hypothetical protein
MHELPEVTITALKTVLMPDPFIEVTYSENLCWTYQETI